MKRHFLIAPIVAILAGCATAGSTVSMVDSQSATVEAKLKSEIAQTRSLYEQQRTLRAKISKLQRQKSLLIQNSSASTSEIVAIQQAIDKLQKKDEGLSAVIAASGL